MKKECILAAALVLAGGLAGTRAQDPGAEISRLKSEIAKLKRETQRAEADIRRTDSLAAEEEAVAAKNVERWRRDRERREQENQALTQRLQETRAKITAERTRMRGYQNADGELQSRDKALLQLLAETTDSLLRRVENGLPWDLDPRRDRLLSLKRDLEAGSASPEEGFSRLAAVIREEIKSGDEVALFNRPLTRKNGETVNAQILKLGNQLLVYMDDEGKKFGILERRQSGGEVSYAWREDLEFAERNAVKLALAVKAGREPPQLVPLELALDLDSAAVSAGKGAR
jgi:hypothetical protein